MASGALAVASSGTVARAATTKLRTAAVALAAWRGAGTAVGSYTPPLV
jgi:hypothetical protein